MSNNPLIPQSKLPNLGTTIFTQMSALAQQHQAINLSQGFPDFDGSTLFARASGVSRRAWRKPVCADDGRAAAARSYRG